MLRSLTEGELIGGQYELVGSIQVGENGMNNYAWFWKMLGEEAPVDSVGYYLGDFERVLGSQVQWAELRFYMERT